MRGLLAFALVASIIVLPSHPSEKPIQQNEAGGKAEHTSQQQKIQASLPSNTEVAPAPATPQGQSKADNHEQESDNRVYKVNVVSQPPTGEPLFGWYLFATVVGVVVNAAILLAMLRQTKINWRQVKINARAARAARAGANAARISADAARQTVGSLSLQLTEMEKTANAAKESADALAGSERAWILVELVPPGDGGMLTYFSSVEKGESQEDSTGLKCLLICKNHGKTPALDVEPMMRFDIFDDFPEELEFEDQARFQRSFRGIVPAIEPGGERKFSFWLKAPGRMENLQRGVAYGLVKYSDIFGKKRTTTFCHHAFAKVDIHPIEARGCHKLT